MATKNAFPGSCPDTCGVDHRAAENRYKSKYDDDWMRHIHNSVALAPCPISDLFKFMMTESDKMMRGTKHENDWFLITILFQY